MPESIVAAAIGAGVALVCMLFPFFTSRRLAKLQSEHLVLEIEQLRTQVQKEKQLSDRLLNSDRNDKNTPVAYMIELINDLQWHQSGQGCPIRIDDIYVNISLRDSERVVLTSSDLLARMTTSRDVDETAGRNPNNCYLVIGDPGGGKSTMIRRWALEVARAALGDAAEGLPLFVPLNTVSQLEGALAQGGKLLEELAVRYVRGDDLAGAGGFREEVEKHIEQGTVMLFLDGMDEVPESRRAAVEHSITSIRNRNPRNLIVLTSRPSLQSERMDGFMRFFIEDFSKEQRLLFVQNWQLQRRSATNRATGLAQSVESVDRQLVSNPLYLTMLCVLLETGRWRSVPSPAALFELFVRELLDFRPKSIGTRLQFEAHIKLQLLEQLADRLFKNDWRFIAEASLFEPSAGEASSGTLEILREIVTTSGILQNWRDGSYRFLHPLFQEFFVARGIAGQIISEKIELETWIAEHGRDERYSNVLAFVVEILELKEHDYAEVGQT